MTAAAATLSIFGALPSQAQFNGCGTTSAGGFAASLKTPGFSCQVGDKIYSDFDIDVNNSVLVSIAENSLTQHTLTVSSAAGLGSAATKFNYTITVAPSSPYILATWQTDTQSSIAPNDYTMTVDFTNDMFASQTLDFFFTPSVFPPLPFNPNTVTTAVTHSFTNPMVQTAFSDTVTQTPGPLPILGAGAAFAFSRKVRSRIKATV